MFGTIVSSSILFTDANLSLPPWCIDDFGSVIQGVICQGKPHNKTEYDIGEAPSQQSNSGI